MQTEAQSLHMKGCAVNVLGPDFIMSARPHGCPIKPSAQRTSSATLDLPAGTGAAFSNASISESGIRSFERLPGTDDLLTRHARPLVHASRDALLWAASPDSHRLYRRRAAGVCGKKADRFIMFFVDLVLTIPSFPITMMLILALENKGAFFCCDADAVYAWGAVARELCKCRPYGGAEVSSSEGAEPVVHDYIASMTSLLADKSINAMRDAINHSTGLIPGGCHALLSYPPGHPFEHRADPDWRLFPSKGALSTLPHFPPALFQFSCYQFISVWMRR